MCRPEDICLDILRLETHTCIEKANALTLLVQKADAMARIVQSTFAMTFCIWKMCAVLRRQMP